jgi:hypothetical protein
MVPDVDTDVTQEEPMSTKTQRRAAARLLGQKGGRTVTLKKIAHLRRIAKLGGWPKGRPRKPKGDRA